MKQPQQYEYRDNDDDNFFRLRADNPFDMEIWQSGRWKPYQGDKAKVLLFSRPVPLSDLLPQLRRASFQLCRGE